jgi:serine/threonine protein kinase
MSPEQILSGPLDRRSDIYSLGLVMFECLTGRMLFENCSPAQIQYKMLHERVPRLRDHVPDIDAQLDAICYTALQFDPNGRYPTAYVMSRELRSYLKRVGFSNGSEPIEMLMRERFGDRAVERSQFIERVLEQSVGEAEIRNRLGIRPVMSIDIFGEAQEPPKLDVFDEDATLMDPSHLESSNVESTIDETDRPTMSVPHRPPPPPPAAVRAPSAAHLQLVSALALVPDVEELEDQTRMSSDADVTRPILELDDLSKPTRPAAEDTKKLPPPAPSIVLPPPSLGIPKRTAFLLWLFGLILGVGLGVTGTLLYLAP